MNIQQIDFITSFESMSNELFMELFEYFDFYSLFHSFNSLNSRIDQILYHCQAHIDLDQIKPIDFVDFLSNILPKINQRKFRSLNASNPHQIAVLADDKCLMYLNHIRSLSLKNTDPNVLQKMVERIDFCYLQRVSLDQHKSHFVTNWCTCKHFLDSNRYNHLRTYKGSKWFLEKTESVSSIECIMISEYILSTNFFHFLRRSRCLKHLKMFVQFYHPYCESLYLSPIHTHDTLTHLDLVMILFFNVKIIYYLFKCVPRLRILKLDCLPFQCLDLVDPMFWQNFLSKYLIDLQQLYLHAITTTSIPLTNSPWNHLLDTDEITKQIQNSTYWSSHGWKPVFYLDVPTVQRDYYYTARFVIK